MDISALYSSLELIVIIGYKITNQESANFFGGNFTIK